MDAVVDHALRRVKLDGVPTSATDTSAPADNRQCPRSVKKE